MRDELSEFMEQVKLWKETMTKSIKVVSMIHDPKNEFNENFKETATMDFIETIFRANDQLERFNHQWYRRMKNNIETRNKTLVTAPSSFIENLVQKFGKKSKTEDDPKQPVVTIKNSQLDDSTGDEDVEESPRLAADPDLRASYQYNLAGIIGLSVKQLSSSKLLNQYVKNEADEGLIEDQKPLTSEEVLNKIPAISPEDYNFPDEKNLTEAGKVKLVEMVTQIDSYLILMRRFESKKDDKLVNEYTLFVFQDGSDSVLPIFSYVLQTSYVPLYLDGILLYNEKAGKDELQVFIVLKDYSQGGKIVMQYVLVSQKKFKNLIYSTVELKGSPNYLRVRNLKNGDTDLMFNVGSTKFVYTRFKRSEVEWFNQLKEKHTTFNVYSQGESMNRECIDFRHELNPKDDTSSSIAFLCKQDTFYSLTLCALDFDSASGFWRFTKLKSIEDFACPSINFTSMILHHAAMKYTLLGISKVNEFEQRQVSLSIRSFDCESTADKIEKTHCNSQSLSSQLTLAQSEPTQFNSSGPKAMNAPMLNLPLPYCHQFLEEQIKEKNPEDLEAFVQKTLETIPIKLITQPMKKDYVQDSDDVGTSSLVIVGKEHMIYRLNQIKNQETVEKLDIGTENFMESPDASLNAISDNRCYVSGLAPTNLNPLISGRLAEYTMAVSKGVILKMNLRSPRMNFDAFF